MLLGTRRVHSRLRQKVTRRTDRRQRQPCLSCSPRIHISGNKKRLSARSSFPASQADHLAFFGINEDITQQPKKRSRHSTLDMLPLRALALAASSLAVLAEASLQDCLNDICADRSDCVAYPAVIDLVYQAMWVRPYNLAIDVDPAAVIRPNSSDEVAAAVRCAADNGVKVQARSGGHSYANFGLGDGALTVDLVNLQGYSMDETTWQATIGAGMTLGDVDTELHKTGRAFAHGVCPGVGIGGHATIGGLGPMSRMWGAALDHIVEVEVVTANGTVLRANEDQNSDLFFVS